MLGVDGKARPAPALRPADRGDADHDGESEQDQRDRTAGARQVPVGLHRGHAPRTVTDPVDRDQARGQPASAQPRRREGAEHQCGRRCDVGVRAGGGCDADRAPHRPDRRPGARVDHVVYGLAGATPAPRDQARGCEPSAAENHALPGAAGIAVVVSDAYHPTVLGGGTAGGDVAAEGEQCAASHDVRGGPGAAVGRQRLGGRAEIKLGAGGQTRRRRVRPQLDRLPGRRTEVRTAVGRRERRVGRDPFEFSEVAVISERDQPVAEGGIDRAVGEGGRSDGKLEGLEQGGGDAHAAPARPVELRQLGPGVKATRRRVDGVDLALGSRASRRRVARAHQLRGGAQGGPAHPLHGVHSPVGGNAHDPPDATGCGAAGLGAGAGCGAVSGGESGAGAAVDVCVVAVGRDGGRCDQRLCGRRGVPVLGRRARARRSLAGAGRAIVAGRRAARL